jgi:hypothetical protein
MKRNLCVVRLVVGLASASAVGAATCADTFFTAAQMLAAVSSDLTIASIDNSGHVFTFPQDGYFIATTKFNHLIP